MEKVKFVEIKDDAKIGLIADVHGNGVYLEKLVKDMIDKGVTHFFFLGDMITDFPDTRQILDLIKDLQTQYPVVTILGNREIDMLNAKNNGTSNWKKELQNGILLLAYNDLTPDDMERLEEWPENYVVSFPNGDRALLTHNFILSSEQKELMSKNNIDILISGHSHRICNDDRRNQGDIWYINPGSLGLNEDSVSFGGCYGIINATSTGLEYEQYKFKASKEEICNIYESIYRNSDLMMSRWPMLLDLSMKTGRNMATIYFAELRRLTGLYSDDAMEKKKNGFYQPLPLEQSLTSGFNSNIDGVPFEFEKDYGYGTGNIYHKSGVTPAKFPSNLALLNDSIIREEIYNVALNNTVYYASIYEINGFDKSYVLEEQEIHYSHR